MQRQNRELVLVLPADIYNEILRYLSIPQLLAARYVSRFLKERINHLLTEPSKVIEIYFNLEAQAAVKFLNHYKTTPAYLKLVARKPGKTQTMEYFCLQLVNIPKHRHHVKNYICELEFNLKECFLFLNQLPFFTVSEILGVYFRTNLSESYHASATKNELSIIIEEIKSQPLEKCREDSNNENKLLEYIVFSLATNDIKQIDAELLNAVIEILKENFNYKNNSYFIKLLPGLKVTLAAAKEVKTPEDWEIIRKGATYVNLSGANLSRGNLNHANLRNAILSSVDLSNTNLSNADLSGSTFNKANLMCAILSGANLSGSRLTNVLFSNTEVTDVNFTNCKILGCNFSRAKVINPNFNNVDMRGLIISFYKYAAYPTPLPMEKPILDNSMWFSFQCDNLKKFQEELSAWYDLLNGHLSFASCRHAIANDLIKRLRDLNKPSLSIAVLEYATTKADMFKHFQPTIKNPSASNGLFTTYPFKITPRLLLINELLLVKEKVCLATKTSGLRARAASI